MKTVTILPTNAKSIKKFMSLSGIEVLRCATNKNGILVTVKNSVDNVEKSIKFFNEFSLTRVNGEPIKSVSSASSYVDFGTLFHTSIN